MKNKKLKKIVVKMVENSFKDGKLLEKKVLSFIKTTKKFSLGEAVYILKEYKKGLKRKMDQYTLIVESTMPLSNSQISKIKSELKSYGNISSVEVKINPDILGGLRVKLGDMIFDDSIRSRIEQVGSMIKGGM